jgi:hypothetical protein
MNLTNLVDSAGQLEDALSGSGFSGIDVGEDTNISVKG